MPGARSALRVDQRRLSSTLSTGALIQRTVVKLSFFLFQCLFVFFCGGLGVGEEPTRGELVRSTHRVPSPFISSQRFPFETFRVNHGILWGWQQLMAISSPLCIIRLC